MRIVSVHHWATMQADVWRMDRGDKIDRHKHDFMHSTGVVRGSTKITLFNTLFTNGGNESWTMTPDSRDYAFDPNVEHEIEALEDGTIIVNMSTTRPRPPAVTAKSGGLMLDTGEIVYDP
jgi:quercetin dioxygenase-like cupin family protein